jgi:hypothetical protein
MATPRPASGQKKILWYHRPEDECQQYENGSQNRQIFGLHRFRSFTC